MSPILVTVETSPLHSKCPERANRRRKLVITPDYDNYVNNVSNGGEQTTQANYSGKKLVVDWYLWQ